jgi:hypothetical protein
VQPDGESKVLLTTLFDGGFVVALQRTPEKESDPCKPIAKIARPENDAERFEMAKNFMRNTSIHFWTGRTA